MNKARIRKRADGWWAATVPTDMGTSLIGYGPTVAKAFEELTILWGLWHETTIAYSARPERVPGQSTGGRIGAELPNPGRAGDSTAFEGCNRDGSAYDGQIGYRLEQAKKWLGKRWLLAKPIRRGITNSR